MAFCSWCTTKTKKKNLIHVNGDPNDIGGDVCLECIEEKAEEAGAEYRFFQKLADEALRRGVC